MKRALFCLLLLAACKGKAKPDAAPSEAKQLDEACAKNDVEACRNLGVMYAQGRGVERNVERAIALFRIGCDAGNAPACNNLGLLLAENVGDAPSDSEDAYRKACDGGSALGCRNLGLVLSRRDPPDTDGARAAFTRACDAELPPACTNLGLLASAAHEDDRAVQLFQGACDAGDPVGCRYMGMAYLTGRGMPRGTAPARVWLDRACAGGDGAGCLVQASLEQDPQKKESLRSRACSLGFREACDDVGQRE